jgi:hypothetical protein
MIRGYFAAAGATRRPYIELRFYLPALQKTFHAQFLVDTGADRTVLAPRDAEKLDIDLSRFRPGLPSVGVGGRIATRSTEAIFVLGSTGRLLDLALLEPAADGDAISALPSILGRDILSRFALLIEDRTDRVLLLEPHEADALAIG